MNKDGKFEGIEYIQVIRGGSVLYTYKGNEVNNLSKLEFQQKIGKDVGQGRFRLAIKEKGQFKNKNMITRGIVLGNTSGNITDDKEKISIPVSDKIETSNYSKDTMLDMMQMSYQMRYDTLKERNDYLQDEIKEYKEYVKELESNNENDNGKSIDFSKILGSVMQLKNLAKNKNIKSNLKEKLEKLENKVPKKMLDALNKVDYSNISENEINTYVNLLASYLPQKEKKEKEVQNG